MTTLAEVWLWGTQVGAVSLDSRGGGRGTPFAAFEYAPAFRRSQIQLAPLTMPLGSTIFRFPTLAVESFHGLPGLLADSLPDKFGNALIDAWLATQGRSPESFDAVERLCYVGARGMGALEYRPANGPAARASTRVRIEALVELASQVLGDRQALRASFEDPDRESAMRDILRVGTSAGGARAKAVIAWNPETQEVRSGQVDAGEGFGQWILKFDGVDHNADKELADPKGYGAVEYAYSLMALDAGITMSECRLLEEGGRRHFMTRRFDRSADGQKLHMQSLAALAHYDFQAAGAYSYEQTFRILQALELPRAQVREQFARMVFNILARNQDDHVKNIAFLMDKSGRWSLSPAYDLTYAYNPQGAWTSRHQMTLGGKRDHFELDDLRSGGKQALLKRGESDAITERVAAAVARWPEHAAAAAVPEPWSERIARTHRLGLLYD